MSPSRNAQIIPGRVITFCMFPSESLVLRSYRPFNVRNATQDLIWPAPHGGTPFFVPAGTRCLYSVFAMHRRTDLWGPDGNHRMFFPELRS
jgi:hypothetical protein